MSIPIVQEYDIYSEGPIVGWLSLIAEDGKITHYNELDGVLVLYWHKGDDSGASPLLGTQKIKRDFHNDARWIGPSVETLATAIDAWLVAQDYGSAPSTDGSTKRGWHLTNKGCYHYVEFVVEPHWQVYGK